MILNEAYYHKLLEKFNDVQHLETIFSNNTIALTVKIILKHYQENKPLHINFQNSKETLLNIARHVYIELANDIYKNHYDLPGIKDGDKVKRRVNGEYYLVSKVDEYSYRLRNQLRKSKKHKSPADIPKITYDRLVKGFVKVDSGVSDRTIKGYFNFFESLNSEKTEFPRTSFDTKSVFISKKPLWDSLNEKSKIPSIYLPNPREEYHLSETKSIPALSDCLVYFTPKYEVCYQQIIQQDKKIKTIIVFDTEASKIEQMILDKQRFGFNLIILSNSLSPQKNTSIPSWNWFKEEIDIVNAI
jgi:hypothetical protein